MNAMSKKNFFTADKISEVENKVIKKGLTECGRLIFRIAKLFFIIKKFVTFKSQPFD